MIPIGSSKSAPVGDTVLLTSASLVAAVLDEELLVKMAVKELNNHNIEDRIFFSFEVLGLEH